MAYQRNLYLIRTLLLSLWLPLSASAWSPFVGKDLSEVPLSKRELQKIRVNAGWAKGDDQSLIFELGNGLSGPVHCGSAQVDLVNGGSSVKQFIPNFAVPANTTRNTSMNVLKGTMKSYSLKCFCFKRKGSEECVNPFS